MSVSYILTPVTPQLLEWGRECGVPISRETPAGHTVSRTDLEKVLQSLDGFTGVVRGSEEDFTATVASEEMVNWEYESDDPLLNQAFGGPHTSPKESADIYRLHPPDQSPSLSFQGHVTLIVWLASKLASTCGPQAAFFLPDQETPVWKEPWVELRE
ncbi:hypothetical protein Enr10x_55750 [Gimesia panareensis]|uniref:Uncharacterized protein n=1 Tax=Gimesia panareensis TaxID=2527978 RepID=A0A517QF55_9PLAN|nr:hypothetical protein [Gimesia panareensis]QDT30215.1 hypothetical protein Enr10x_55750 [Gimesia panareensis]